MKRNVMVVVLACLTAMPALGLVSNNLQIQGILTDENGTPLVDGTYNVEVRFFKDFEGGPAWSYNLVAITQTDGFFTAEVPNVYVPMFSEDTYLELTVEGESPMTPRIPIYPVPSALSARTIDPTAAVTELNGMVGQMSIVGGENVTVTLSEDPNTITINAAAGAGGDDGDWTVSGDDIYRDSGRVHVGQAVALAKTAMDGPAPLTSDVGEKTVDLPPTSKLEILAQNEGLSVLMQDTDTAADGRAAIFGKRDASPRNHGTSFHPDNSNAAIMGVDDTGEAFCFGVSAFGSPYYGNSGALLAASPEGAYYSAMIYRHPSTFMAYGLYSNLPIATEDMVYAESLDVTGDANVGGVAELNSLRLPGGAAAGYLLTSDASGNATWAPPASVQSDGDWNLSGSNVYRSGSGTVTMGTSSAHNYQDNTSYTTMQIHSASNPTLALDSKYSVIAPLYRWTMTGGSAGLNFRLSNSYSSAGVTAMHLDEDGAAFYNASGVKRVEMFTEADMDDGGSINLYGDQSTNPALMLDGRAGTGGGRITVLNGAANEEVVVITANHNNTGVGRVTTPVLEITGGSDLSEQFDISDFGDKLEPGMVVSIDSENPGRLALSSGAYDRRVAGVISGAGGVNTGMVMGQQGSIADGELPVALVGRVYVWADAGDGPIEPGDLLTTSDVPGHAMKVTDHGRATGAILGKAMTGLSEGQGLILTLVTLQ